MKGVLAGGSGTRLTMQRRQALPIACREVAFQQGRIRADQLKGLAADLANTLYGGYLAMIAAMAGGLTCSWR